LEERNLIADIVLGIHTLLLELPNLKSKNLTYMEKFLVHITMDVS
jgi:hypothetical protein